MVAVQAPALWRSVARVLSIGGLAAIPALASATPHNFASYGVSLKAVTAPNQGAVTVPGASDLQSSYQYSGSTTLPSPVQVAGGANTGTNHDGYGFASGFGFSRAEAGVLKVSAGTEAQAVAQPGTNVGASASAIATAEFEDLATFTTSQSVYQNMLIISGTLKLTGNITGTGYAEIHVGGTGLNPRSSAAEWIGDSNGTVKDATGHYTYGWVPGTAVDIPFSFTVYSGQASTLLYWMKVRTDNGGSFAPCPATGGLCDTVQLSQNAITADYSHTLAWGGVTATDWFGNPVALTSVTSNSGFDYSAAYSAPAVPEPETWTLMLAGLGLLGAVAARSNHRA
ncbi:PEP-CTERM sorting domain-containing protein [Aquabacterium sp.]|uniref:PEP-CTERM sorting domain-containing protein n=1 Tax=Aquabacterium sp. TaxID=1872578 RepID=UPI0035B22E77